VGYTHFLNTFWIARSKYREKYIYMSCHQNAGQNHNMKIANKSMENVAYSEYFRMAVTNQNFIHEEFKSRLTLENAWYNSVQYLLSSCLLYKNLKIETTRLQFYLFCMDVRLGLSH